MGAPDSITHDPRSSVQWRYPSPPDPGAAPAGLPAREPWNQVLNYQPLEPENVVGTTSALSQSMTVLLGEPALRKLHVPAPRDASPVALQIIDDVLAPTTCRALIDEAGEERLATTDDRPRVAILDAPVLTLRLFYRLVEHLPNTHDGAELVGLKPLLRCVEYLRGDGAPAHRDPIRETVDGLRSAMSVVVFLNDEFAGGSIEFPELRRVVEAKLGRAIVFPHSLLHVDHVVEDGRKLVLETDVFYSRHWRPYRS